MNIRYCVEYKRRVLELDEKMETPDSEQSGELYELLVALKMAHDAGGKMGAYKSWVWYKNQNPSMAHILLQSEALIHADELKNLSIPVYLMAEYPIYAEAFNVVVGASGGGKSFVALDIAGRIAMDYTVVYVAGEGLGGYAARWEAWKNYHQIATSPSLYFYREAVQLLDDVQMLAFTDLLKEHKPYLVIVDTLARSAVGVDENSAKDMGLFVRACDVLRSQLECGLIVVHHTGKSGDIRGSTALYGAADAVVSVTKVEGLVRVSNKSEFGGKNKYGDDKFEAWYKITPHEVDGMNGAVIVPAEKIEDNAAKVNDTQLRILRALLKYPYGATADMLEKGAGRSSSTIYRNLKQMIPMGFVSKSHEKFALEEAGYQVLDQLGHGETDEHDTD